MGIDEEATSDLPLDDEAAEGVTGGKKEALELGDSVLHKDAHKTEAVPGADHAFQTERNDI